MKHRRCGWLLTGGTGHVAALGVPYQVTGVKRMLEVLGGQEGAALKVLRGSLTRRRCGMPPVRVCGKVPGVVRKVEKFGRRV